MWGGKADVRLKTVLLVALGGALGAMLRFAISTWSQKYVGHQFPVGTLLANIGGCLVFGFLAAYLPFSSLSPEWKTAVFAGFLGALTTFSTFSFESLTLFQSGRFGMGLTHLGSHLFLGIGAVVLGFYLGQNLSADRPTDEVSIIPSEVVEE